MFKFRCDDEVDDMALTMKGQVDIKVPHSCVWVVLNDLQAFKTCVSGCQKNWKSAETHIYALVEFAVGTVRANFPRDVHLSQTVKFNSYRFTRQGRNSLAGFATTSAFVRFDETASLCTKPLYDAHANICGRISRLGSRLVNGLAKFWAEQRSSKFVGQMTADPKSS